MRAIAFALLAIGAEFAVEHSNRDDNGDIAFRYFRISVGWFSGFCAVVALVLAIMGL
jgi:hypothetical protein